MRYIQAVWPLALGAMRDGADAALVDVRRMFDGLCRWRAHRTKWVPTGPRARQRAGCHYLVEAAARLTIMDWVHAAKGNDSIRDICAVMLASAEEESLREAFEPLPLGKVCIDSVT